MFHAYSHYILRNVEIWTPRGRQLAQEIEVEGGKIVSIRPVSSTQSHVKVIDGRGRVLLPAGVDPQVHLRVPGQAQKETPGTGLLAALRGGVAAVLTMPNTKPTIDSLEVCEEAVLELQEAEKLTGVKVFLSAAISQGLKGQVPVAYKELADWGVRAFTDDGLGVVEDELMRAVFAASAETGLPVLQHAEFPGHGGVLAAGPVQEAIHSPAYPAAAEADMVARDIRLLREFPKARYHVLHVSARETLALVKAAKAEGLPVSCEVTPHHLWFSSQDILPGHTAFKMNPPLRQTEDRSALREALREGLIDFVATDHAPHEAEVKSENFKTAAFGTTGLETSLRVLLTLYAKGELSSERLVEVFSTAPARFLGIQDEFGDIAEGRPLRAVLVDVEARRSVTADDLFSLSKNNCFLGTTLQGELEGVFLSDRHYAFLA
jgi:dihydroorotase